jgi:hypothetical protein
MTDGQADRSFAEEYRLEELPGMDLVPRDMRDALNRFSREGKQIVESFLGTLESQEPPPIIYHYTNDLGLRGILESGQLWLTDIFSLNDPSELRHGFSHAIKVLNSKVGNGSPASRKFVENFAAFARQGAIQASAHYFMCSFSASGDDLGQWRAYADNGRGYVLGFDGKALENGFTKEGDTPIPNNCTFQVTYKDAQLVDVHRQIIEKMFDLILLPRGRDLQIAAIKAYMAELQMLLTFYTLQPAPFFKHEAYANEKEFRFLQIHKAGQCPEVKVRTRPYSLVRYREFNWRSSAANALKRIVVGPAADHDNAAQFARDCLGLFHAGAVEIAHSEIPYRAV